MKQLWSVLQLWCRTRGIRNFDKLIQGLHLFVDISIPNIVDGRQDWTFILITARTKLNGEIIILCPWEIQVCLFNMHNKSYIAGILKCDYSFWKKGVFYSSSPFGEFCVTWKDKELKYIINKEKKGHECYNISRSQSQGNFSERNLNPLMICMVDWVFLSYACYNLQLNFFSVKMNDRVVGLVALVDKFYLTINYII